MEVYHNGEWSTVCDDGWDLDDAQVVCNELGLGPAIAARHNVSYGQGDGKIWLDNLKYIGTELRIRMCSHSGWGVKNCNHSKDAGVQCSVPGNVYSLKLHTMVLSILMYIYINIYNYIIKTSGSES